MESIFLLFYDTGLFLLEENGKCQQSIQEMI